jgi:hypothetical protein
MLKKYKWPIIAVGVFIIGAIYVLWNPPSTKDKLEYWKGEYAESKRIYEADAQIKLATIAELQGQNALLQGSIDSANTIIANLEGKQGEATNAIGHLTTALGQAKTDAERVPILTSLVDEWKGKFTLAQAQIAEKDKVIFSLTTQYHNEISVSANYKSLYESEHTLRLKCEEGIGLSDKRIASLTKQVKLWKGIGVIAVIATALLKK